MVRDEASAVTVVNIGPTSPAGGADILTGGEGAQTRLREVIRTDTQQIAIGQSFQLGALQAGESCRLTDICLKSATAENFDDYSGQLQIRIFAGTQNSSNELATYSCNLASHGDGTAANEIAANDWVRFSLGPGLTLPAGGTYSFLMFFDASSGANSIHKWGFRRDNSGIYGDGNQFECTSYMAADWDSDPWNNVVAMNGDDFMFYVAGVVNVDSDGDGLTDAQEIALGTDPGDPASVFGITESAALPITGKFRITWPSRSNILYRIWESPDLAGWNVVRNWTASLTPPDDVLEFDLSPSNGFYKIEAYIQ